MTTPATDNITCLFGYKIKNIGCGGGGYGKILNNLNDRNRSLHLTA